MRCFTLLLAAGMLAACAAPGDRSGAAAKSAQQRAVERERELLRECRLARAERREDPRCAAYGTAGSRNPNQSRLPVELPVDVPGGLL